MGTLKAVSIGFITALLVMITCTLFGISQFFTGWLSCFCYMAVYQHFEEKNDSII